MCAECGKEAYGMMLCRACSVDLGYTEPETEED